MYIPETVHDHIIPESLYKISLSCEKVQYTDEKLSVIFHKAYYRRTNWPWHGQPQTLMSRNEM